MIQLNQRGLEELSQSDYEGSLYLKEYVSTIKVKLDTFKDCTFWVEDETVKLLFDSLPEGNQNRFRNKFMLLQIFSIQAKQLGVKHIIVDSTYSKSDNWIYEKCGVWIMTANYFFTMLYAAVKEINITVAVDELDVWSQDHGFTFDIMLSDNEKFFWLCNQCNEMYEDETLICEICDCESTRVVAKEEFGMLMGE
jgi:hypothetical protein